MIFRFYRIQTVDFRCFIRQFGLVFKRLGIKKSADAWAFNA